ncbi:MAG: hypothetical protein ACI9AR_000570 [Flavobacteriaceae bacterium]|jgi:hypothetical protein
MLFENKKTIIMKKINVEEWHNNGMLRFIPQGELYSWLIQKTPTEIEKIILEEKNSSTLGEILNYINKNNLHNHFFINREPQKIISLFQNINNAKTREVFANILPASLLVNNFMEIIEHEEYEIVLDSLFKRMEELHPNFERLFFRDKISKDIVNWFKKIKSDVIKCSFSKILPSTLSTDDFMKIIEGESLKVGDCLVERMNSFFSSRYLCSKTPDEFMKWCQNVYSWRARDYCIRKLPITYSPNDFIKIIEEEEEYFVIKSLLKRAKETLGLDWFIKTCEDDSIKSIISLIQKTKNPMLRRFFIKVSYSDSFSVNNFVEMINKEDSTDIRNFLFDKMYSLYKHKEWDKDISNKTLGILYEKIENRNKRSMILEIIHTRLSV